MVLPLPRESCWHVGKYLYTDILPGTLPRNTASGQLFFFYVMKNLEISEGFWITGADAVHSEGHGVMVST